MMCEEAPYQIRQVRFVDQLSLTAVRSAVSTSRQFLRLTLSKWRGAPIEDDVLLVASELVTNAITVTGVVIEKPTWGELAELHLVHVCLVGLENSVVIEVWDGSEELPRLTPADDDAEDGRGLLLVQQPAGRWGSYRAAGGKVVWAELAVHPPLPQRRDAELLGRRAAGARPDADILRRVPGPDAGFLRRVLSGLDAVL
ncbi:ATP-binding protein [Streptomyces sp. NPDC048142]|uniref:ATP-binding protein n=1 Tax=Streptomyces sp. NPDC048142 TaxID=3365501 RepID=UPI0037182755